MILECYQILIIGIILFSIWVYLVVMPYYNFNACEPVFRYYKATKKRYHGLCGMTVVYIEACYDEVVQKCSFEDFIKMNHGDDFSVTEITKEEYDNRIKKSPN